MFLFLILDPLQALLFCSTLSLTVTTSCYLPFYQYSKFHKQATESRYNLWMVLTWMFDFYVVLVSRAFIV